jgi:hypothetical protein
MNILKKVRAFLGFNITMKLLLIEAFLYLGWARYFKMKSFNKVAPSLGEKMRETTFTHHSSNNEILRNVSKAIHIMSSYTFWESKCLVKAIAGMRMLEKRIIENTLYLGTAKNENGELIAHAWLRSGLFYISGSEQMVKFTVVAKFAKKFTFNKHDGENY